MILSSINYNIEEKSELSIYDQFVDSHEANIVITNQFLTKY